MFNVFDNASLRVSWSSLVLYRGRKNQFNLLLMSLWLSMALFDHLYCLIVLYVCMYRAYTSGPIMLYYYSLLFQSFIMLLFYPCGQSQNCFLLQLAFLYIQQEAQLLLGFRKKGEKRRLVLFLPLAGHSAVICAISV